MSKRALVIGINAYRDVAKLRGCVNDTTNLRAALTDLAGFGPNDVRLLVDERASKREIERRLGWLVEGAKPGDLLVLHFSGHGAQVRDRDEQDELSDQLDEILCPWDLDWEGTFITDDYLNDVLKVPDGVVLEVILDCCNSGDGNKEAGVSAGEEAGTETSDTRLPRFLRPPAHLSSRRAGEELPRIRLFAKREPAKLALWSACADVQTAADAVIDGVAHGAFTFYLCKHLRETEGRVPRAELLALVRASLRENRYTQIPELAAPARLVSKPPFTS